MKHLIILAGIVVLGFSEPLFAQTFHVTPDSISTDGTTVSVSIIGEGLHFTPHNPSDRYSVSLYFESSDSVTLYFGSSEAGYLVDAVPTVVNDTLISAVIDLPTYLPAGWYQMTIWDADGQGSSVYGQYANPKAVYVIPKTVSLTPSSAYPGQNIDLAVSTQGVSLGMDSVLILFVNDSAGIYFSTLDTTAITAVLDSIVSSTAFTSHLTIPGSMIPGLYDVYLYDALTYENIDSSLGAFQIYEGIEPTVVFPSKTVMIAGDTVSLDMVIHGAQVASGNPVWLQLDSAPAIHSNPSSVEVTSDTSLTAFFLLDRTIPAGYYDVLLKNTSGNLTIARNAVRVEAFNGVAQPSSGNPTDDIAVTPNPATNRASFSVKVDKLSSAQLTVYDALGRTVAVLSGRFLSSGTQSFEWITDNVPNGDYFYELDSSGDHRGGKIIVRH